MASRALPYIGIVSFLFARGSVKIGGGHYPFRTSLSRLVPGQFPFRYLLLRPFFDLGFD